MILNEFNFFIKNEALALGFPMCGVCRADMVDEVAQESLNGWIESRRFATMEWVTKNGDVRANPKLLLDGAQTIVVFGYPYTPIAKNFNPNNNCNDHYIASYAHAVDYHYTIKEKLKILSDKIERKYSDHKIQTRYFTDSAPIMERYWGVKAGMGWIGRSGMLINPQYGSFFLLAELVINAQSDVYDENIIEPKCGECRRCVERCPSGAILERDKQIDANRCLSYLTIEHRGDFDEVQKKIFKKNSSHREWVFGCDECIGACPYNQKIVSDAIKNESNMNYENGVEYLFDIDHLEQMTSGQFRREYGSTPLFRAGLKNLKRNFLVYDE